ncbi:MAG: hypothetical protein LBP19_08165 [Treponema sp.]|jgi:hypothetical protein|nr:hypothetical protein [Treponema sp.]
MSKLHIIGIGGTGHKLVTAVIHLAASGAFKGNLGSSHIDVIRIMTIDADVSNGNLKHTNVVLSSYQRFYNALSAAGNELGLISVESISPSTNISLYKDEKKSISEAFKIPQYRDSDDDTFIRFLYTDDEIDAEFNQGFYGHTSIGTLVVENILSHDEIWRQFKTEINANDFVVVMGSIFGGTGASAIPVVLDDLKAHKREADFKFAAIILTPYFKAIGEIAEEGRLQPNSNNFQVKAKTALYYYYVQEQYKKTDALYVIGEPEINFSNEVASRGSDNQRNKTHPIELFAAMSIIDFVKENNNRQDSKIITAQREASGSEYYYTWKMIQDIDSDLPLKMQKLMKIAVFYNKILYGELKNGTAAGRWEKNYDGGIQTDKDENQNFIYENLRGYLELFVKWMYDLHKKNLDDIDQNTGRMKWTPDARVKLFNAGYPTLFDNMPVENGEIDNFKELVYNDTNQKLSAKIYSDIAGKKPLPVGNSGKRFPSLFVTLGDLVTKQELRLFGGKAKTTRDDFVIVPYLSKENGVTFIKPDADQNKLWSKSEPTLLINIADGLPNVQGDKFVASDVSIPSPWSIFIVNELTLVEPKFASLNKTAYNQWCGLLTLLALRKLNLYERAGLQLRVLRLGTVGDGEFLNTMKETLIPNSYIFDNPNWINACCVSLSDGEKDEVIAFLAHNTIVCPAYSYSAAIKTKLYTMAPTIIDESGKFLSPDNYFKNQSQSMNRDAKYALKLFLDKLKACITKEATRNQRSIIKALQKLVEKFIADIGKVTPNHDISLTSSGEVESVYDLFDKVSITSNRTVELPFLLAGTRGQRVALIGVTICGISSSSQQASTIFITDTMLYNQIHAANIQEYSGKTIDGVTLMYENDLLGDSMVMINKGSEAVFHTLPNRSIDDYEVIWPIHEKLLEWYTMEQINDMLSIRADNEKVTITLGLALSDAMGKHSVTKEYTIKKIKSGADSDDNDRSEGTGICFIFDKNYVPFWAAWPYAEILDRNGENTWQRYNFFCVEPNFRGIPVLEIEPFFTTNNYLLGQQKLSTVSSVVNDIYYRRYRALPVALKLKQKISAHSSIYMGAVFLAEPKKVQPGSIVWNIGFDFGTTTSTAFYTTDNSGSLPAFIQLNTEYHWVDGSSEPQKREIKNDMVILSNTGDKRNVENYFIDPHYLRQNGYATTYEKMDTTRDSASPTIFETGRIFWHNFENFRILNSTEGRRDRLLTNIKWETNLSYAGKYLNQLLTHIVYNAAEKGVRKINWFFSYPTAFSQGTKTDFGTSLNAIITGLRSDTGIDIVFNERNLITESIAAAFYFRNRNSRQTIFLCVDIGGNTSDISLWIKTKHVFQTSIRFASRDMFVAPLEKLLEIKSVMDVVRTDRIEDGIHTMLEYGGRNTEYSRDKIKYFIETVLFEYYSLFKNRLDSLEGDDKQAYKNFKHSVFIAYSGLIYYLANAIAALLNSDDPDKKIDNDITQIVLGLSGKGSKLTDWIRAYCSTIYAEAQNLIAEKTISTTYPNGIQIRFLDQFSPDSAKTETAIGMICDVDTNGNQKNTIKLADPEVFIGCNITVTQGDVAHSYKKDVFVDVYNDGFFINPNILSITIDRELSEFGEFLDFFNRIASKTRGDMPIIQRGWFERERQTLWNQIRTEIERVLQTENRFDPPFIVMLKVFLDEFSNSGYKS